jgi:hypothetical protein
LENATPEAFSVKSFSVAENILGNAKYRKSKRKKEEKEGKRLVISSGCLPLSPVGG